MDDPRANMMDRGFLLVAVGLRYKREALTAVARLGEVMPDIPILIYGDWEPEEIPGLVEYRKIENPDFEFTDKTKRLAESPFQRTIFFDTDTWVVEPIYDVFDLLAKFDIVGVYENTLLHDKVDGIPSAYPEINTGMVGYRKTPEVWNFLDDVVRTYEDIKSWAAGDQTAFRMCLYHSDLRLHVLSSEYNCQIRTAGALMGKVKVIHARNIALATSAKRINRRIGRRVYVASLFRGFRVHRCWEFGVKLWSAGYLFMWRARGITDAEIRNTTMHSKPWLKKIKREHKNQL